MLQTDIPHGWLGLAAVIVGCLLGREGIAALYRAWQNRNKAPADVQGIKARTELTLVQAGVSASEMVRRATQHIREAQEEAIELRHKLEKAEGDIERLRIEKSLLYLQIKQCANVLERHGIKDELDVLSKIISNG